MNNRTLTTKRNAWEAYKKAKKAYCLNGENGWDPKYDLPECAQKTYTAWRCYYGFDDNMETFVEWWAWMPYSMLAFNEKKQQAFAKQAAEFYYPCRNLPRAAWDQRALSCSN